MNLRVLCGFSVEAGFRETLLRILTSLLEVINALLGYRRDIFGSQRIFLYYNELSFSKVQEKFGSL